MKIKAHCRCISHDGEKEVELRAGGIYDLPDAVARHLIKYDLASEIAEPPKQQKVVIQEIKTTKRPITRGKGKK